METRNPNRVRQSLTFGLLGKVLGFLARSKTLQEDIKTPFNMTQRQWIANKINVPVEQVTDQAICMFLDQAREELSGTTKVLEEQESAQELFDKHPKEWRKSIRNELHKLASE